MDPSSDPVARVIAYHERTKHHPNRYARAPGYMDWATQPDPFRTYSGAPQVALPLAADEVTSRYCDLYVPDAVPPSPLELESVAAFFELALGLTAWKEFQGSRWALRSDPSSGNLHPTEAYAVLPGIPGLPPGVHHYVSRDHCLEQRCRLTQDGERELARLLPAGGFLIGIASIHWREAWKYGERAFRYCQHDAGHVIATVRYAAAALGWSAWLLDGFGDALVGRVLGLDREQDHSHVDEQDREHPDAMLLIAPRAEPAVREGLEASAPDLAELMAAGTWSGTPNVLSSGHQSWDVIDAVAEAAAKPPSVSRFPTALASESIVAAGCEAPASTIIRQRRSAVALDGVTSITRSQFYSMLERVVPRPGQPPWDVLPWEAKIHLGIFVHRVADLTPGLYLLERTAEVHEGLATALGGADRWTRPADCPEHLRLFQLREADLRRTAASVSCQQDIAGDGAFSLGMLADFRDTLEAGAFWYRRLFWETGVLGQVLYLEAEAAGVRGTGIGCYFDDLFHQVLGLENDQFQSLYHFTVGGPVEDGRLATLPAYGHLDRHPRGMSPPV